MYKLIVKPFAELDVTESANWYNKVRDGLGNEFLLILDAKINSIHRNPIKFPIIFKNIRRALTERFPFGIFFIVENDIIYILAILHTSRSPKTWKKRD